MIHVYIALALLSVLTTCVHLEYQVTQTTPLCLFRNKNCTRKHGLMKKWWRSSDTLQLCNYYTSSTLVLLSTLDVSDPKLPRRYDDGSSSGDFPRTSKENNSYWSHCQLHSRSIWSAWIQDLQFLGYTIAQSLQKEPLEDDLEAVCTRMTLTENCTFGVHIQ